jgi:hypothetical protein
MIPAGARWMLEQYRALARDLKAYAQLMASSRHLAITLLGKSVADMFRGDVEVTTWLIALYGAVYGPAMTKEHAENAFSKHKLDNMSRIEYDRRVARFLNMLPEKAEAWTDLRHYIAQAIKGLRAHIEWLDRLADRDLAIALQKALIDQSNQGQKLLKYEKQHEGTFNTAQRQIDKIKNPPPPPRAPRGPGKNETVTVTTAAPATTAVAEVTPDPSPAPRAEPTSAGAGPAEVSAPTPEPQNAAPPPAAVADPGAVPVEITSEPISEAEPAGAGCPGPRTSEDVPVFEPTDEELEREFPKVVAFQRLHDMIAATYGTGTTPGQADSRPRAPANPGEIASKAISSPLPPPGSVPPDPVRAPPKSDRDRGPPRE